MKRLIFDLDHTLCFADSGDYENATENVAAIEKLREYKENGYEIVISTSRNVRTYSGNVGKINAFTLPKIVSWLTERNIPFDEIYIAKPWCGEQGFYVDDKAIRPDEFVNFSYEEIAELTGIKAK